jgi:hypothetical protein
VEDVVVVEVPKRKEAEPETKKSSPPPLVTTISENLVQLSNRNTNATWKRYGPLP